VTAAADRRLRRFGRDGTPSVVIVGAGLGGIATGVKLCKAGIDTFTIVERSPGVGGVWWDNRYPGAEVDVPSHLYSYSFARRDWSRTHARRDELHGYLEDVVDQFDLRRRIRLGTSVNEAMWDEATHTWAIHLDSGETLTCHILISAVGFLNYPNRPTWPGLGGFAGPSFHTSEWDHAADLQGKRIAVVGTGSTAAQVVPELAGVAEHLYVFQRDPGWVMPKGDRNFTDGERAELGKWRNHWKLRLNVLYLLEKGVLLGGIYRPGTKLNTAREQMCRRYIDATFADRPDLRAALTPAYHYPGKRPIFATGYYPALLRDNVELVPHAVTSVTERGVIAADGIERQVDVLVYATGYLAANYLPRLRIVGRGGKALHDVWDGEPAAFLGLAVPGFPNFFMIYGPNTNGGEIVSNTERQAEYAVRVAQRLRHGRVTSVEVKRSWYRRYNVWLQNRMQNTSWSETRNYFTSPSGRIVTQWPYGATFYGLLTKLLGRVSEKARTLSEPRERP